MTKIQQVSIPIVLQNKNCAIKSETGSGKTLAYLAPILSNYNQNDSTSIQTLIICPTRELGLQIYQTLEKIIPNYKQLNFGLIVGGEDLKKEKSMLRKGLDILIATPGKLLYHLKNTQSLIYDNLKQIVFEESDRTLDLGFQKELESIIEILNQNKAIDKAQKILISATFNEKIENLCLQSCKSSMTFIGFNQFESLKDDKINIPKNLIQKYCIIDEDQKLSFLIAYLYQYQTDKIIIFVHTIDQVEYIENILSRLTFRLNDQVTQIKVLNQLVLKLHGNIEQKNRQETYNQFKTTQNGAILICTDVASRGLDFYDVKYTILLDMPDSLTEYAHRIGRTARINKLGYSLIILMEKESNFLNYLKDFQIQQIQKQQIYNYFTQKNIDKYREAKNSEQYIVSLIRGLVSIENELYFKARKAYNSYMRAYQYNKNKKFPLKALNLLGLAKGFGLNKVITSKKETNNELYQQDLQKRYQDKNEYTMSHPAKKNKMKDIKQLQNMEFM